MVVFSESDQWFSTIDFHNIWWGHGTQKIYFSYKLLLHENFLSAPSSKTKMFTSFEVILVHSETGDDDDDFDCLANGVYRYTGQSIRSL